MHKPNPKAEIKGPISNASLRRRQTISFPGTGRTKQAMKAECDINNIMKRYQATGIADFVNTQKAVYADVRSLDFTNSMNSLIRAQNMFGALPSSIRKRFANDPAQFLDFMSNEENAPEARKLGLLPALTEASAPDGAAAPAPSGTETTADAPAAAQGA